MQIALIVLIVAGVWAVVELALVLRRTRGTVDTLDKTVGKLNDTIDDVRPVINKPVSYTHLGIPQARREVCCC